MSPTSCPTLGLCGCPEHRGEGTSPAPWMCSCTHSARARSVHALHTHTTTCWRTCVVCSDTRRSAHSRAHTLVLLHIHARTRVPKRIPGVAHAHRSVHTHTHTHSCTSAKPVRTAARRCCTPPCCFTHTHTPHSTPLPWGARPLTPPPPGPTGISPNVKTEMDKSPFNSPSPQDSSPRLSSFTQHHRPVIAVHSGEPRGVRRWGATRDPHGATRDPRGVTRDPGGLSVTPSPPPPLVPVPPAGIARSPHPSSTLHFPTTSILPQTASTYFPHTAIRYPPHLNPQDPLKDLVSLACDPSNQQPGPVRLPHPSAGPTAGTRPPHGDTAIPWGHSHPMGTQPSQGDTAIPWGRGPQEHHCMATGICGVAAWGCGV